MNLLLLFIILNIVNVILQTIKSIATVKCGKWAAALVNATAYGLYTIVLVYTNCELNLWAKVAVVAGANMVGVYVVKVLEEKMRKDRLWKIEATFDNIYSDKIYAKAIENDISTSRIELDDYTVFYFYCPSQKESHIAKEIINEFDGKYFVSESKIL